jgi:hypothetical protein
LEAILREQAHRPVEAARRMRQVLLSKGGL